VESARTSAIASAARTSMRSVPHST
jgi:hypothetical protein